MSSATLFPRKKDRARNVHVVSGEGSPISLGIVAPDGTEFEDNTVGGGSKWLMVNGTWTQYGASGVAAWATVTGKPAPFSAVALPAASRTVATYQDYLGNNAEYNPLDFGAVGDGVTDDTAAFNTCATKALSTMGVAQTMRVKGRNYYLASALTIPAGVSVVCEPGVSIKIAAASAISFGLGASWEHGQITWTTTSAIDAFVPTADKCKFIDVEFVGSGAIGSAGTPLYQRAIFGSHYSYIHIQRCRFNNMTVGIWAGGASTDPAPVQWRVTLNEFTNIVGYRGQSEGYALGMFPLAKSVVSQNIFTTIARHAIYFSAGASLNQVSHNIIDTCDNVAIQMNTNLSQPACDQNTVAFNTITNITKSIAYGYSSAVGIGLFGNNTNNIIIGNRISEFVDIGIQFSSPSSDHSGGVVGFGALITKNWIDGNTGVAASDACIRTDNPDDCVVTDNDLLVANNQYGIVVDGSFTPAVSISYYQRNRIRTLGTGSVPVRISCTSGAHVFGPNDITGPCSTTYGTSGGSSFVIVPVPGYVGVGDNDLSYYQGVLSRGLNQTTTLTANRVITLSTFGAAAGDTVHISRPSTGAFTCTVKDGSGTTIKALSTGQWVQCMFDGSAWQNVGSGSI
jgi:hypothetical protein